jgi:hypothetical protein
LHFYDQTIRYRGSRGSMDGKENAFNLPVFRPAELKAF